MGKGERRSHQKEEQSGKGKADRKRVRQEEEEEQEDVQLSQEEMRKLLRQLAHKQGKEQGKKIAKLIQEEEAAGDSDDDMPENDELSLRLTEFAEGLELPQFKTEEKKQEKKQESAAAPAGGFSFDFSAGALANAFGADEPEEQMPADYYRLCIEELLSASFGFVEQLFLLREDADATDKAAAHELFKNTTITRYHFERWTKVKFSANSLAALLQDKATELAKAIQKTADNLRSFGASDDATDKLVASVSIAALFQADGAIEADKTNVNKSIEIIDKEIIPAADNALPEAKVGIKALALNMRAHAFASLDPTPDFDKAIESVTQAIALDGKFAFSYENRAQIYAKKGDKTKALEDLARAVELSAKINSASSLSVRGNLLLKAGEVDKAFEDFTNAMTMHDVPASVFLRRAQINWNNKHNAVAALQDACHCIDRADNGDEVSDIEEFIAQELTFAADDKIGQGLKTILKGLCEEKTVKTDEAIETLKSAINSIKSIDSAEAKKLQSLAVTKYAVVVRNFKKDYKQAHSKLDEAIKLDPLNIEAMHEKGMTFEAEEKDEQAIAQFGKAIDVIEKNAVEFAGSPMAIEIYTSRASLLFSEDKESKAMADLEKANRMARNKVMSIFEAYYSVYTQKEDHKKALENINKAIELSPFHADFYEERAKTFESLNKQKESERDGLIALYLRELQGDGLEALDMDDMDDMEDMDDAEDDE